MIPLLCLTLVLLSSASSHARGEIPDDGEVFYTINAPGWYNYHINEVWKPGETGRRGSREADQSGHRDRFKREALEMTDADRTDVENTHNTFRAAVDNPTAADMKYMGYDAGLEEWATLWAAECKWYHGQVEGAPSGQGQNLWLSSVDSNWEGVIEPWNNEVQNYTYATNACDSGAVCGHYTQVVWANSDKVGCGKAFCAEAYKKDGSVFAENVTIASCHYSPAGNTLNKHPYEGGAPCTKCTDDATHCFDDALCRDCDGEGISGCDCKLSCYNCGTRNDTACSCDCLDAYAGDHCASFCENKNLYYCAPGYSCSDWQIRRDCPLKCGECVEGAPECAFTDNEIRLIGGTVEWEGRVEIQQMPGIWSTVCSEGWDMQDATVVCNELGFERGAIEPVTTATAAEFGAGSNSILLYNVDCAGTESNLATCSNNDPSSMTSGSCHHDTDIAGVRCAYAEWSEWSEWSACNGTTNMRTRNRICDDNDLTDNVECILAKEQAPDEESEACTVDNTPMWGAWGDWGACSEDCGVGTRIRTQPCLDDNPDDGIECEGRGDGQPSTQTETCNIEPCPETPEWGEWGLWADCSLDCGGGVRVRQKPCLDSDTTDNVTCVGNPPIFAEQCNTKACPTWSEWSAWSDCSELCGVDGIRTRDRSCMDSDDTDTLTCEGDVTSETEICNYDCPTFGQWSEWSTCDVECGDGNRTRSRTCLNLKVTQSVSCDDFENIETEACNAGTCPYWDWGIWSNCSAPCGTGTRIRTQECNDPDNTLIECSGTPEEPQEEPCNTEQCPFWEWGDWSNCTEPCGNGTQTRTQECIDPDNTSMDCTGTPASPQQQECNTHQCPFWEWGDWSNCTEPCGNGTKTRSQECIDPDNTSMACTGTPASQQQEQCNTQQCADECYTNEHGLDYRGSVSTTRNGFTCQYWNVDYPHVPNWTPEDSDHNYCRNADSDTSDGATAWCHTTDPSKRWDWCDIGARQDSCDIEAPTLSNMPADIFVEADLGETNAAVVTWTPPIPDDDSGNVTMTSSHQPGDAFPEGTTTVTYTATDAAGNTVQESFKVIVSECCTAWSDWGGCSEECGNGTRTRQRSCNDTCPGASTNESETCNIVNCPTWNEWGEWTDCSVACGGGNRTRDRVCQDANTNDNVTCKGSASESGTCNTEDCPTWSEWGLWGECSVDCGGGTRTRERVCQDANTNDTVTCEGSASEPGTCNTEDCPTFGQWSEWSACDVECGEGNRTRSRTCKNPKATETLTCDDFENTETEACNNTGKCPFWEWGNWTECNADCGTGVQERTQDCKDPDFSDDVTECTGEPNTEQQECNTHDCPFWDAWATWSDCSKDCGTGVQNRTRECNDPYTSDAVTECTGEQPTEQQECNAHDCPFWDAWGTWNECSKDCGSGVRNRTAECNDTYTFDAVTECSGEQPTEWEECNTGACPYWLAWGEFSTCSVTCGGGNQTRTRNCFDPDNTDGVACSHLEGLATETFICNDEACPVPTWGTWTEFGECSEDCGGGTQTRTRTCIDEDETDTIGCEGSETDEQDCNTKGCPYWLEWSEWSACTLTCGGGTQTRTRNCFDPDKADAGACSDLDPELATETDVCNVEECPDTEPPTLTIMPADIVVGPSTVTWIPPTPDDDSGVYTMTSNYEPGDVFPVGTTTVTYTVTDADGNNVEESFTVTVSPQECYTEADATDYIGQVSTTVSGRTCQNWDSNSPHAPNYRPTPGDHNYCRNPDGDPKGAWCYTTDPDEKWEYCEVGQPRSCTYLECFTHELATDYRGQVHTTQAGVPCQNWASNYPHTPNVTPESHSNEGIGDHNYCRNPDGGEDGAWCYTTDPDDRWDFCDIGEPSSCTTLECHTHEHETDYRGTVSTTKDGIPCQNWATDTPHDHPNYTPENHANKGLGDHNYCRNPDGDVKGAWCYTTDPSLRYDYCEIGETSSCIYGATSSTTYFGAAVIRMDGPISSFTSNDATRVKSVIADDVNDSCQDNVHLCCKDGNTNADSTDNLDYVTADDIDIVLGYVDSNSYKLLVVVEQPTDPPLCNAGDSKGRRRRQAVSTDTFVSNGLLTNAISGQDTAARINEAVPSATVLDISPATTADITNVINEQVTYQPAVGGVTDVNGQEPTVAPVLDSNHPTDRKPTIAKSTIAPRPTTNDEVRDLEVSETDSAFIILGVSGVALLLFAVTAFILFYMYLVWRRRFPRKTGSAQIGLVDYNYHQPQGILGDWIMRKPQAGPLVYRA